MHARVNIYWVKASMLRLRSSSAFLHLLVYNIKISKRNYRYTNVMNAVSISTLKISPHPPSLFPLPTTHPPLPPPTFPSPTPASTHTIGPNKALDRIAIFSAPTAVVLLPAECISRGLDTSLPSGNPSSDPRSCTLSMR